MWDKKITIFGASGATGQLLTERCLAAGHSVKALLRNPAAFRFYDRVEVVHGDAKDAAAVQQIVAAMEGAGVRRIIVLGSAGALDSALDKQPAWRRWMVENLVYKTLLKWPVAAQRAQYAALAASSLDWTMVMPPMLTNGVARGTYRVDGDALPRNGSRISRRDVVDFMMQQIDSAEWVRRGVYLSQ